MEQGIFYHEKLGIIHNLDPVIFSIGSVEIRYYGIIFAFSLFIAFIAWSWQMRRGGYSKDMIDSFLIYGVVGTIVGARLGHCLFYEWERFSHNIFEILKFWQGGLASHGATIGLLLALFLYSRRYKVSYLEIVDRFTFSAAIGAIGVRLGNFLNSGIVGRVTDDLPWGVRFVQHDFYHLPRDMQGTLENYPLRHPSQIYEFLMGIFILLVLLLVDRLSHGEKRPVGLLTGIFLGLYFLMRFGVEFFKEYQTNLVNSGSLTMGQYLSVIPFLIGLSLIIWALISRRKNEGIVTEV